MKEIELLTVDDLRELGHAREKLADQYVEACRAAEEASLPVADARMELERRKKVLRQALKVQERAGKELLRAMRYP